MTRFLYAANPSAGFYSVACKARSRHKWSVLVLGAAVVLSSTAPAIAQAPVLPVASTSPAPTAPAINILVLPLDELTGVTPTAPPLTAEPVGVVTPAAQAGITPTSAQTPLQIDWVAVAQRRRDKDADRFTPTPDFGGPRPIPEPKTIAPEPTTTAKPQITAPVPVDEGPQFAPPGRAQLAAINLRSGLTARGYGDILNAAPDSATIMRTLGERRLTPRVLLELRASLATLLATPNNPYALSAGTRAAARVGQALDYRAIVPLYVDQIVIKDGQAKASFVLLLVDAARETGEAIVFDETGADEKSVREAGALTATALLDKALREWPLTVATDKTTLAQRHIAAAQTAMNAKDFASAQDELNQAIALNPSDARAYVLLGDALSKVDPQSSAAAYRRAVEVNARDGETWAKIASSYANAPTPDWPRTLEAGRRALAVGHDSVALRLAMATAQFGRADLFKRADRLERAEDAEFDARNHLERALQLAPDDPTAIRLLARSLVSQGRYDDAIQTLDNIAPRFPQDLDIQTQYASALIKKAGREEDAFVAYSRAWKLANQAQVDVDAITYRALAQGFDVRVYNLGRAAVQLTTGVANAAVPRESAFLQLNKFKADMTDAEYGINTVRAPANIAPAAVSSRVFAADLTSQSLEALQTYLETGQDVYRSRGLELYRQAVSTLNLARTAQQ